MCLVRINNFPLNYESSFWLASLAGAGKQVRSRFLVCSVNQSYLILWGREFPCSLIKILIGVLIIPSINISKCLANSGCTANWSWYDQYNTYLRIASPLCLMSNIRTVNTSVEVKTKKTEEDKSLAPRGGSRCRHAPLHSVVSRILKMFALHGEKRFQLFYQQSWAAPPSHLFIRSARCNWDLPRSSWCTILWIPDKFFLLGPHAKHLTFELMVLNCTRYRLSVTNNK